MSDDKGLFRAGDWCNGYKIVRPLGEGGFGSVYEAIQPLTVKSGGGTQKLGRHVALKCLRPSFAGDPEQIGRLNREALALMDLEHPNIVRLIDLGVTETGIVYLVMDLLRGCSLLEHRKAIFQREGTARLSLSSALLVAVSVAEGMVHAHSKHITHRDLKPANIFITDNWIIKILDLGAAKYKYRRFFAAGSTEPGRAPWTPGYAAPEQIEGSPDVDRRADIFSLGVMMYEMLAGVHPFAHGATNQTMIVERQLVGRAKPLTHYGIAEEIAAIVHRAMARRPEDRYQSTEDLLEPLRTAITAYAAQCDRVDQETRALLDMVNRQFIRRRLMHNDDTDPCAPPAVQDEPVSGEAEQHRSVVLAQETPVAASAASLPDPKGLHTAVQNRSAASSSPSARLTGTPTTVPVKHHSTRLTLWESLHSRRLVRRVVASVVAVLVSLPIAALYLDWIRKTPSVRAEINPAPTSSVMLATAKPSLETPPPPAPVISENTATPTAAPLNAAPKPPSSPRRPAKVKSWARNDIAISPPPADDVLPFQVPRARQAGDSPDVGGRTKGGEKQPATKPVATESPLINPFLVDKPRF